MNLKKALTAAMSWLMLFSTVASPVYADDVLVNDNLLVIAEQYYGDNGNQKVGVLNIAWDNTNTDTEHVKAGEDKYLTVSWSLNPAATYSYTDQQESMFDSYNNTKISFVLPEGVTIDTSVAASLSGVTEVTQDGNTWYLHLNPQIEAKSGSSGTITVPIKVNGNGVRGIGEVLDFTQTSLDPKLITEFTVLDRSDPLYPTTVKDYQKTISGTSDLGELTTTTDDVWTIEKKAISATPSSNKETITVKFEITVGLLGNDGAMITNPESYARNGRVPFDGNVLLDEIPTVKDREGETIEPSSIFIAPQFGEQAPVNITGKNTDYSLPYNICGNVNIADNVDPSAPYLSQYLVEITYSYDEFIASFEDENQDLLTIENEVAMTYTLKGGVETTVNSSAEIDAGEVTQPAKLIIQKYIVDKDNKAKLYSSTNFAGDSISGAVQFTITDQDGNPATLYQLEDGKYTQLEGNKVEIAANSDGQVEVYLKEGTYIIKETVLPTNTEKVTTGDNNANDKEVSLQADSDKTVAFYNKELVGSITVDKTGKADNGDVSPLSGATFGLYTDKSCATLIKEGTTTNGSITFDRLPYGTYYVKEISAPAGYVVSSRVYIIEINEDNQTEKIEVVNNLNHAYVKLEKYVSDDKNTNDYRLVDDELYLEFSDAFSLQQKTGTDEWIDIKENLSLSKNGTYLTTLPVYDDSGQAITYRFKEVLPDGYHNPKDSGAEVMYSDEFTLVDSLGEGSTKPQVIKMNNDRNGSIEITKEFYDITADGYKITDAKETAFDLYYMTDGTSFELYNTEDLKTQDGKLVIKDLPRFDMQGNVYKYYLVEKEVEGYALDSEQKGDNTASDILTIINFKGSEIKAFGPFDFSSINGKDANLNQTITVANYEQKVGIIVKKIDSITKNFVEGASFTVYQDKGNDREIYKEETEITSNGVFVKLELGKKYLIEETTVPDGYTIAKGKADVDLTSAEVDKDKMETITLSNLPDPKLKIDKTIVGNNTKVSANDITFEVYVKNGDTFERAKDYDGADLTITAGQEKQMPVGIYYLKEAKNYNVLDPSDYSSLYDCKGKSDADGNFYFGPFVLEQVSDSTDLTQTFAIENYSVYGAIEVVKKAKKTDGTLVPLSGATIGVYNEAGELLASKVSGSSGTVIFTNLLIYDANGNKVTYTVKEISAPDGYGIDKSVFEVKLTAGKTVNTGTKDNQDNSLLQFVNLPKMTFEVTKVFYNIWEHQFTDRNYLMSGAQIALFEEDDNGDYRFVELKTTDNLGVASFTGLEQDKEYIAVEYAIPDVAEYSYLESVTGKKYLSDDYSEDQLQDQTLNSTDIEEYYYVTKEINNDDPVELVEKTLYNVEHWTQLRIFKFIQNTSAADDEQPINNAEFTLYMQTVSEDEGSALKFDWSNIEQYTVIGHYSSGTLYDEKGIRQDGWFATDILKSADNVVYWLVEETPGIGATKAMASEITLIKRTETNFTNASTASDGTTQCNNVWEYLDDTVTTGKVENDPAVGDGSTMYSTVRIAKWAGAYDEDGNRLTIYNPLGNVSFDLYIVHANGTIVEKIDTLTTGLDNDLSDNGTSTTDTDLTAWASSRAFSFDSLEEKYKRYNVDDHDIIWEDGSGNGYVRVMLKETSTPGGYDMATQEFKLIMYFEKGEDPTEIFNDVYYVKTDDQDITLAEDQDDWGFYPTKEEDEGNFALVDVDGMDEVQYRLVNWPVDNFAVTVTKYGYEVTDQNLGLNAAELDDYFLKQTGRGTLSGAQFKLQRYSTTNGWVDYSYSANNETTFTTDENGYFAFPNGLGVGRYRLIEIKGSDQYENIYNGKDITGESYYNKYAYYFNVTNDNVHISLYNPKNIDIAITKQTITGEPLSGASFQLVGAATITGVDNGGTITFSNIGSGEYKLEETAAPSDYDNGYLGLYLQDAYANSSKVTIEDQEYSLATFDDKGIYLGYTTVFENGDVLVKEVIDLDDYLTGENEDLVVKDPSLSSLTITKKDAQNDNLALAGAKFEIEFKPFTSWDGEEILTDSGWTLVGNNYITEANGSVVVNGLRPGIYKVTEIKAPSGYDLDSQPQIIILKGGMDKIVTYNGATLAEDDDLIFENYKLVDLTLTKIIDSGTLAITEDYSFTFNLKDDSGEIVATKTINFDHTKTDQDLSVTFTGLIQGATYSLKEVDLVDDFTLKEVKVNNETVTVTNNSWSFAVPKDGTNVSVSATNTYMYGKIIILKVDAADGAGLSGAGFGAYRYVGDYTMQNDSGEVTELADGEYEIIVQLTNVDGNKFKIQEIAAPYGYLKEYPSVDITIRPGETITHEEYDAAIMRTGNRAVDDPAMLAAYIFPNYRGSVIRLTKFDNMREAQSLATLAGVGFTLYEYQDSGWTLFETATTDNQGVVEFTVKSGSRYAIRETSILEGYTGLQGLWLNGDKQPAITVGSDTYYLINNGENLVVGNDYYYNAYNVPKVELEIRKYNVEDQNSTNPPTATVSIYQVPDSTSTELSETEVIALMNANTAILSDVAVSTNSNTGYSYANKDTLSALGNSFAAGNTYLIVETEASISQIRNDDQVVWYVVHTIPAGTKEKQIIYLYNLDGKVEVTLDKTTSQSSYDSLLTNAAELHYTITPEVTNTYPLEDYVLVDSGLVAYNDSTELDFAKYLKDHYSINRVVIGQASDEDNNVIKAVVTFYDFNDQELLSQTVTLDQERSIALTGTDKAKKIEIRYSTTSGEAIGKHFKPGAVEVTIDLDKQDGGEGIEPITKVVNTATVNASYYEWDTKGEIVIPSKTLTSNDISENTFGEPKTALVSLSKRADKNNVALDGGEVKYTLSITNAADATGAMGNPFIVDLLPKGTEFVGDLEDIEIVASAGISVENFRTDTREGETALFLFLSGDLQPGKTIDITIPIKATIMAAVYGPTITNYAIAGSRVQGVQTTDNPRATSYKTSDGRWPQDLDNALTTLSSDRKEILRAMLGNMAGFGYIATASEISWSSSTSTSLIKTGRGDRSQDTGFSSTHLSTVNNDGYMEYQLIFSNLSTTENYTNVTLLDVLPFVGDKTAFDSDRGSQWQMIFDEIEKVEIIDSAGENKPIPSDKYWIFYYTQTIAEDNIGEVYDTIEQLKFDTTAADLPTGWTEDANYKEHATAIAIAIAKDEDWVLKTNQSYMITYKLNVGELDEIELAQRSWTNAVNNFSCHYQHYVSNNGIDTATDAVAVLSSNSVSNTIMPNPVKVGGHIWIDKDADGVWDEGEYVADFNGQNQLINKLLEVVEVSLYTYEGTGSYATDTDQYVKDDNWYEEANFVFEDLDPASKKDGFTEDQLYSNDALNNPLQPAYLKGEAAKTYNIGVTIPETADLYLDVTSLGGGDSSKKTGYSRHPLDLLANGAYADEAADNNYTRASTRTSVSERFFLYATGADLFDNTKDIGIVFYRGLIIEKVDELQSDIKLANAEFKVYGPFDTEAEANSADLNETNLIATVTTDDEGIAKVSGLNWFQYYVIVESESPQYYQNQGAIASNTDGVIHEYTGDDLGRSAWILAVPEDDVTNDQQTVVVTNTTEIDYTIEVLKYLDGKELDAKQFAFVLMDENMEPISGTQTVNDADGKVSFGPLVAREIGQYTYYIKEVIPDGAVDNVYGDIKYDDRLIKVIVDIAEDPDDNDRLKADITYYAQDADGNYVSDEAAGFENVYLPSQTTTYQPSVLKQFTDDSDERWQTINFNFVLRAKEDYDSMVVLADGETELTATIKDQGSSYFDVIHFYGEGEFAFTIEEVDDGVKDYLYDETVWTLTVKTEKVNGVLAVTDVSYQSDQNETAVLAIFENAYYVELLTSYKPSVLKQFTDDSDERPQNSRFDFLLQPTDDYGDSVELNAVNEEGAMTLSVIDEGTGYFDEIIFKDEGTFCFTIKEVDRQERGYTYDDQVWTLEVKTKKVNGELVVLSAKYTTADGTVFDQATFTNHYKKDKLVIPPTGDLNILAVLTVTGLALSIAARTVYRKRRRLLK